jgi:hypothetical protein
MSKLAIWPPEQAHLQALFVAYTEASGIPLSPSHDRKAVLREMDRRGLTPEDVRAVIGRVKWHLAKGTKGFSDASLDWRNAMGDADKFEERALKLRQEQARKAGVRPVKDAAQTRQVAAGESVTVLAPEVTERKPINLTEATRAEIEKLRGG